MSRKSKQSKHKKKFTASLSPVDKYLDLIGHQIFQENYTIAKNNLAALPGFRRTGPPDIVALNEPFKHSKLKQSITFIKE